MRIIRHLGRRGPRDAYYAVNGTVRVGDIETAVDIAFDARNEQIHAPVTPRTLWSVYRQPFQSAPDLQRLVLPKAPPRKRRAAPVVPVGSVERVMRGWGVRAAGR